MNKIKVCTVVGTRPEIIRLSRTIALLDKYTDHTLVHTGQNYDYELNEIFFEELGIRAPNIFLECAGATAAETIGQVIAKSDEVFAKVRPEAVLILGDTNSALSAISAKRQKIPIFHMEAGNRCFDLRVPEEINRKIVDHISDVNLPYSSIAREYLLKEGLHPSSIIKTGSPMREVLDYYSDKINASTVLERLDLVENEYVVMSVHREENVDSERNWNSFLGILKELPDRLGCKILLSTHPRTRKKLEKNGFISPEKVIVSKPLGFPDYISVQRHAKLVLSDSGTITEESSILNFPAINLREAQERPEGFEEGAVMFTGMNNERILQAAEILSNQGRGRVRSLNIVADYETDNVSDKILRAILSNIDYVNRFTWRKLP